MSGVRIPAGVNRPGISIAAPVSSVRTLSLTETNMAVNYVERHEGPSAVEAEHTDLAVATTIRRT